MRIATIGAGLDLATANEYLNHKVRVMQDVREWFAGWEKLGATSTCKIEVKQMIRVTKQRFHHPCRNLSLQVSTHIQLRTIHFQWKRLQWSIMRLTWLSYGVYAIFEHVLLGLSSSSMNSGSSIGTLKLHNQLASVLRRASAWEFHVEDCFVFHSPHHRNDYVCGVSTAWSFIRKGRAEILS